MSPDPTVEGFNVMITAVSLGATIGGDETSDITILDDDGQLQNLVVHCLAVTSILNLFTCSFTFYLILFN